MDPLSDNTLMTKVQDGDLDKLGLLFERYKGLLFGYFYNMNRDASLAEDLVQAVFVRIIRYKSSFKGTGEFRVWMMHIARNLNIDHHKKSNRVPVDELKSTEHDVGHQDTWESGKIYQDEMSMLDMAMERLPTEKREVLVLSKLDGLKYSRIAELLDCSEGAVKAKVFRALQALRKEYEHIQTMV